MTQSREISGDFNAIATQILMQAETMAEAVYRLFHAKKALGRRISLGSLCKAIHIPSTGYLSDVMQGKKHLARKYVHPLAQYFALSDAATAVLFALHDIKVDPDGKRGSDSRLHLARKRLSVVTMAPKGEAHLLFFAFDVFASFGLFDGQPSYVDLHELFSSEHLTEKLDDALAFLLQHNFIRQVSDAGRYELVSEQVVMSPKTDVTTAMEFIRLSLFDAAEQLEPRFSRRDSAFFTSQSLSVRRDQLLDFIQRWRQLVDELLSAGETKDGDMLLRVNVQVYPAAFERSSSNC